MMSENSIEIPDAADREIKLQLDRGCTVIYVADTDKLIGYIDFRNQKTGNYTCSAYRRQ